MEGIEEKILEAKKYLDNEKEIQKKKISRVINRFFEFFLCSGDQFFEIRKTT